MPTVLQIGGYSAIADLVGWVEVTKPNISTQTICPSKFN
jgi:hypothetical protein